MEYRQEKKVEEYLCKKIKKIGGYAMKITSPGLAGVPDRLVLFNGVAVFVELKAPNGEPDPRQRAVHRKLYRLGFPVAVVYTKEMADRFVSEVERRGVCTA